MMPAGVSPAGSDHQKLLQFGEGDRGFLGFIGEYPIGNIIAHEETPGTAAQEGSQEIEGKQVLISGGQWKLGHGNLFLFFFGCLHQFPVFFMDQVLVESPEFL